MSRWLIAGFCALLPLGTAFAEDITVQSLLEKGYEIKGVMPSTAGPGILLQKGTDLVMCFVAETAQSADIATTYCKPVH
jgi:hypothetical protein